MRVVATGLAIALAGCASVDEIRARASAAPDFEVCRVLVEGDATHARVAAEQVANRRLDCSPYMAALNARQNARSAQAAEAALLMRAAQPAPIQLLPQPAPAVYCTSNRLGNTVNTVCR